ncbi:MAG: hypothetical protein IT579_25135 [Verrucomicrobia subdivision 3 bacterium]|nr:hypothetical protein [Limisphaerales bacterium]
MDAGKLIERARAARAYTMEEGAATFSFVLPMPWEVRRAFILARLPDGSHDDETAILRLLTDAMTGWNGVVAADFLDGAGDESVTFSAAAAREYLAARVALLDRLSADLFARLKARAERGEGAAKN